MIYWLSQIQYEYSSLPCSTHTIYICWMNTALIMYTTYFLRLLACAWFPWTIPSCIPIVAAACFSHLSIVVCIAFFFRCAWLQLISAPEDSPVAVSRKEMLVGLIDKAKRIGMSCKQILFHNAMRRADSLIMAQRFDVMLRKYTHAHAHSATILLFYLKNNTFNCIFHAHNSFVSAIILFFSFVDVTLNVNYFCGRCKFEPDGAVCAEGVLIAPRWPRERFSQSQK